MPSRPTQGTFSSALQTLRCHEGVDIDQRFHIIGNIEGLSGWLMSEQWTFECRTK
jgi:hypothetical protein